MSQLNIQKKFVLFIVLTVFLLYLILPFNLFSSNVVLADEEEIKTSGSTIGSVSVAGLERNAITQAVTDAIISWKSEPVIISGGGEELSIDVNELQFNVEAAVDQYELLTDKPWYAFWVDEKTVHLPIDVTVSDTIKTDVANISVWNAEETLNQLTGQASYLKSHDIEASVNDISHIENDRLALTMEAIPEGAIGISYIAQSLNDKVLNPNEPFSLLETLGENSSISNKMGLNFLASVLYNTVLQTNFAILERHSQNEIPTYLEPGIEAQVSEFEQKDLKFVNTTTNPALIKATVENDMLKLEIYSTVKESDVSVRVEREEIIAPRIINRYSTDLPIGQTTIVQEGQEGLRISVFRNITENGNVTEEHISRDYYKPINRIVLNSSRSLLPETDGTQPDTDLNIDLNGDGLPDLELDDFIPKNPTDLEKNDLPTNENELPPGSYYDKGGNLVTP
ncbi:VanW family protein [Lysinibacillus antri]|uniref:Vancomycin resistance protein n=1 Tax=Lysinibacillus antri TaxID=2498145 RepID=A0A432LFZ7_9BACI|nr:VanW family protein [Lysinibacillus antri]RUL55130.1 vancomycin resistance protein [Lysinibacillus antri]